MSAVFSLDEHVDAVPGTSRFSGVTFNGAAWDLSHLNPFGFRDNANGTDVDVVVFFSCHCFTHKERDDPRSTIPTAEYYVNPDEVRVLDEERYNLSRQLLPQLVTNLKTRHIRVLENGDSFCTMELVTSSGAQVHYVVIFSFLKDRQRKNRFLLRVKTAYPRQQLTRELSRAGKVRFQILLNKTAKGEKIRG